MFSKIKICGITNIQDAHAAVDSGADALGFIFVPDTPRYVVPETVKRIISELPPFITTVGVFADTSPEAVSETIKLCGLSAAQLHGSETPDDCNAIATRCQVPVIKAFRIKDRHSLSPIQEYDVSAYNAFRAGKLTDYEYPKEKIEEALTHPPKIRIARN